MKFSKIKWDGKRVELHWTEKKSAGTEIDQVLKSFDQPSPTFRAVFTNFASIVCEFLELPPAWLDKVRVTGLSTNEEEGDGRAGLVITTIKSIPGANSPLVMNTPHLREPVKAEERDADGFMSAEMVEAMETAWLAAERFLNGDREQVDMFKNSEKKARDETTVSVNGGPEVPLSAMQAGLDELSRRRNARSRV